MADASLPPVDDEIAENVQKRKPGRPKGSLNKTTIQRHSRREVASADTPPSEEDADATPDASPRVTNLRSNAKCAQVRKPRTKGSSAAAPRALEEDTGAPPGHTKRVQPRQQSALPPTRRAETPCQPSRRAETPSPPPAKPKKRKSRVIVLPDSSSSSEDDVTVIKKRRRRHHPREPQQSRSTSPVPHVSVERDSEAAEEPQPLRVLGSNLREQHRQRLEARRATYDSYFKHLR